jgi:hypothetical protein
MRKFYMLAKWRNQGPYWFESISAGRAVLCDTPTIGVYVSHLEKQFEAEAGSLAEAKIKFNVGAAQFGFVNKGGRSIYDAELTMGDVNAIRRTTLELVQVFSDEAITFMLTSAGIVPSELVDARPKQLATRILGIT